MSKCIIVMDVSQGDRDFATVTFEGDTVTEALAMKAEYLMQTVGATAPTAGGDTVVSGTTSASTTSEPAAPTTPKPSGFLSKVKGGE